MKTYKPILISLTFIFGLLAAFGAGYWLHAEIYPTQVHFPVLSEAYQLIKEHGYQEIPENPMMEYGAIHGLVNAYGDQHTHFLEPVQAELNNDTLSGSYGGIGAQIGHDPQGFFILHPFPDSPSANAGIQDGDRLLMVDSKQITSQLSVEQVIAMVRGLEGEFTRLTISRPPEYREMKFSIKRANIPLPSVTFHLDPSEPRLGVIRVNVIASSTPDEIKQAVHELQGRGATHFVLDLRGNGGGLLREGVDIARIFLEDGVVIQHQDKDGDIESFEINKPGQLGKIQLAVLVDGYTASAAEIISGALQNHGRAPLIGTNTFGKDTIQLVFELQDNSSLHVTSAKWWLPGLQPPVGQGGLQPDIVVSSDNSENYDPYLEAAIQFFFGN